MTFMYSKKTKKINITVNPYFLDDQSEPEDQHFVWAYQVTIDNQSNEKVQLKNRYWKIIDSNGSEQEVRGEGDATAAAIYANSFSKDPEFYEFTRSLRGYGATFSNKSDILLIDPKSDFFKYLNKSNGTKP